MQPSRDRAMRLRSSHTGAPVPERRRPWEAGLVGTARRAIAVEGGGTEASPTSHPDGCPHLTHEHDDYHVRGEDACLAAR